MGKIRRKQKGTGLIIVAGCGRLGANIASMFSQRGHDVVVIDPDADSFRKLSPEYSGFTVEADATDIDVLKDAGIDHAEIVVAFADGDNVNIMVSQIAKVLFGVPAVIVRLYDTDKEKINSEYSIRSIHPVELSVAAFEKMLERKKEEEK